MPKHFVLVGAGQAAAQTATTLRQRGFDGDITVFGDEAYLPYQRPPLSKKFLSGELEEARLYIKPEKFYADKGVEVRSNTRIVAIDRSKGQITAQSGEAIPYDRLLLATGSRVRELPTPGVELGGIFYLRTMDDVLRIRPHFESGKRLVVVGGGYIGLEVAAVARAAGLDVIVLEALDRVLARVVAPQVSEFYARFHRDAGVDVRTNVAVTEFRGDRDVRTVITESGDQVDCDLVVIGIGILPETALAEQAGLSCDNGIAVDDTGFTTDPDILAAGDCTNHPSRLYGHRIRLESVANAIEQGKTAADSLLGEMKPYDEVPWFWSDQYDLKLQIVGLSQGYDQVVIRGDQESNSFAAFYLKSQRLIAVDAINRPREFMQGKKLVRVNPIVDVGELADDSVPITDTAKKILALA